MQKIFIKIALLAAVASLTACSNMPGMYGIPGFGSSSKAQGTEKQGLPATSVDQTGKQTNVNITMTGGGEIGLKSMDAEDKSKMSHALDSGTGKATQWANGATGINYTVTPVKKVEIKGNPFCRTYVVVVMKGDYKKEVNGTACVTTDGSWHTI
jgi:surface antigen